MVETPYIGRRPKRQDPSSMLHRLRTLVITFVLIAFLTLASILVNIANLGREHEIIADIHSPKTSCPHHQSWPNVGNGYRRMVARPLELLQTCHTQ